MMRRLFVLGFTSILLVMLIPWMSKTTYADCGTPIGAPHQGAARRLSPGNFIYGIFADISYSAPVLGCQDRWDSFTEEWIMVVGPGPEEWLQFGWERTSAYPNVHYWYQYHHQGAPPVDVDIPFEPAVTHQYWILSERDANTGEISWILADNGVEITRFTATEMGWTQPTTGASEAQWSAELSYGESEMGGLLPDFVFFDNIFSQEGSPDNPWYHAVPTWTFDSFVSKYGGDTVEVEPYHWRSRNWTWPHQIHLPLIDKNS